MKTHTNLHAGRYCPSAVSGRVKHFDPRSRAGSVVGLADDVKYTINPKYTDFYNRYQLQPGSMVWFTPAYQSGLAANYAACIENQ